MSCYYNDVVPGWINQSLEGKRPSDSVGYLVLLLFTLKRSLATSLVHVSIMLLRNFTLFASLSITHPSGEQVIIWEL